MRGGSSALVDVVACTPYKVFMRLAKAPLFMAAALACWLVSCSTPTEQPETAPADWEVLKPDALASSQGKISFAEHVKPVLEAKCLVCHNRKATPLFSMANRASAFGTSSSGTRIVPGKPNDSLFIFKGTKNHAGTMPPVGERLTENEKRILTAWVEQGAEWPDGAKGELRPTNGNR